MADRLEPKGKGASDVAPTLHRVDHRLPGEQQAPNPMLLMLRNVETLYLAVGQPAAGLPQGRLTGVQDEDDGRSERRSVMDRIRVRNMTRPVRGAHVRQVLDREIIDRTDLCRNANEGGLCPILCPCTRKRVGCRFVLRRNAMNIQQRVRVAPVCTLSAGLQGLEPYAGKLARTVLRGLGRGNRALATRHRTMM